MDEVPDTALIQQTLAGNESAFAELTKRHSGAVWRTIYRILGSSSENEDALQEVFLRAYTSLNRFDSKYPFGPWIVRIATNYCIDQLRRKKARKTLLWTELPERELEQVLNNMSRNGDASSMIGQNPEKYERVAMAMLEQLKPKYRSAFVLRELEGLSYQEIAQAHGISEITARVRVSRARADIQKRFRRYISGGQKWKPNQQTIAG
jgi:RNA polymerase sigma-70 factor, ECF subfamily